MSQPITKYNTKTVRTNVYAYHKDETIEQKEANIEAKLGFEKKHELIMRMNFNALMVDVLNTNAMELEALMKQTGHYKFNDKQKIKQIVRLSKGMLQDLDKALSKDNKEMENCAVFGDKADFIFDILNLATGIPEDKHLQAISTLKILCKPFSPNTDEEIKQE